MNSRLTAVELSRITEEMPLVARPDQGWLRAAREALGLSRQRVADTLEVSHAAVRDYEAAELSEAITLRTFKRMAAALDCELVYALVPRNRQAFVSSQPTARATPPVVETGELASHLK